MSVSELDSAEREEILAEFLAESRESLDRIEVDLVALESDPTATRRLASVFRAVHTMKGTCGWLGFPRLEALAHAGEDLLTKLREGEIEPSAELISAVLALADALRRGVQLIAETHADTGFEVEALIERIGRVASTRSDEGPSVAGLGAAVDAASQSDNTIRVDVDLLDLLMNQVGELVLARNRLVQFVTSSGDAELMVATQRLNLVAGALQASIMRTRMQPIRNLWSKLPRLVRDLSLSLGKEVQFSMEGANTELDRTLIEAIKDPLAHLIRNAMDHGIESPQERGELGKPSAGRLGLRAYHEGGHVNIEVSDDGRGINPDKLRKRAVELGLLTQPQATALSEREAFQLVFQHGLSTADAVTAVSGRGVGMDVVRANIEAIGGSIEIFSRLGEGTTWKLKIPLTLAIIPALVIGCEGQRYAVPQVSLVELVHLEPDGRGIEWVYGAPVHRLRGNLLPLVHLGSLLRRLGRGTPESMATGSDAHVVVVEAEGHRFGLVVGGIFDTEEIVVKPLGSYLRQVEAFAGATIMGDGRVALILDVLGIARMANVLGDEALRNVSQTVEPEDANALATRQLLLLESADGGQLAIDVGQVTRLEEFPREQVERLGGGQVVQYRGALLPLYSLSSLLTERRRVKRPSRAAPLSREEQRTVRVVVRSFEGREVGLIIDRVIDIVAEAPVLQEGAHRPGVIGTCIVRGRATELLDLSVLLGRARATAAREPQWIQEED